MDDPKPQKQVTQGSNLVGMADVGFRMAIMIGLGTYAGHWLDARMGNSKPYCSIIGALLSIFGSLYMVYRAVTKV
ncbi:MAG: putative F0F1-ATPase subunit Ca2+/Mg2+ transporter [Bacteroidota bacterium]